MVGLEAAARAADWVEVAREEASAVAEKEAGMEVEMEGGAKVEVGRAVGATVAG